MVVVVLCRRLHKIIGTKLIDYLTDDGVINECLYMRCTCVEVCYSTYADQIKPAILSSMCIYFFVYCFIAVIYF